MTTRTLRVTPRLDRARDLGRIRRAHRLDPDRNRHKWPIFVPALVAVAAVMNLAGTDWSDDSTAFLVGFLGLGVVWFVIRGANERTPSAAQTGSATTTA